MTNNKEETIKVEDYQTFLRKCLNCKQLELVDFAATKLLPVGENYCSIMGKLNATIRKTKGAKEEKLYCVAKMLNPSERPIVEWPLVFKKEVFMYTELIPAYQRLERQLGIEPVLDVLPKYIGHRCSLNDELDVIDEHSMLVLENLKSLGYYTGDRCIGLDVEHARIALSSLARYHALGIALKQKQPGFFKTARAQAESLGVDFVQLDEGFDAILPTFLEKDCLSKHLAVIEANFEGLKNGKICEPLTASHEPWGTITHGDFWVNNIMFHKDKQGRVDSVKFVDFQTYLYNNPLRDLPYFLCGSLDEPTKARHVDELIDLYHESFMRSLERMGCDPKPFAREAFDRELKQQALRQFPLCALAIKFFVFEIKKEHEASDTLMTDVFDSKPSDVFIKKLQEIIDMYEKRGWF